MRPAGADIGAHTKGTVIPSIPLPENPSIEQLKKQVKLVHRLVRSGDGGALDMVREFHPRADDLLTSTDGLDVFTRADARLVIARLYGFGTWSELRYGVDLVREHTGTDPADRATGTVGGGDKMTVDHFVALACVSYNPVDVHARLDEAAALLEADPALSVGSLAALAATGQHRLLAAVLDDDPDAVERATGPNRWPPLLYCTYSRVLAHGDDAASVATAQLLVDRGAGPNAGFLWHGLVPPFTALTGALGRGEGDQPPHPDRDRLLQVLLEAGADPNDGQGLYNNGLAGTAHDDPTHLRLLHGFGLGESRNGPWYRRFGDRLTPPAELLYDELEVAAWRGLPNRMRFLVGLDLDLERGVGRSGRPPLELAIEQRHDEVVDILRAAGATTVTD